MENGLTIKTHPNNIKIDYLDNNTVKIQILNEVSMSIEFGGDVLLKSKGDFTIASEGEIGLISIGHPICIETIRSNLYLNSREAKSIKNIPESLSYKKIIEEENKSLQKIENIQNLNEKSLLNRVEELEDIVVALIKALSIK